MSRFYLWSWDSNKLVLFNRLSINRDFLCNGNLSSPKTSIPLMSTCKVHHSSLLIFIVPLKLKKRDKYMSIFSLSRTLNFMLCVVNIPGSFDFPLAINEYSTSSMLSQISSRFPFSSVSSDGQSEETSISGIFLKKSLMIRVKKWYTFIKQTDCNYPSLKMADLSPALTRLLCLLSQFTQSSDRLSSSLLFIITFF